MDGKSDGPRRITLTSAYRDGAILVTVRDSGTGIALEMLPRLFNAFCTTKATGLGMGLHISRSIVEAYGGKLWAENNPEGGATFAFSLPAMVKEGMTPA